MSIESFQRRPDIIELVEEQHRDNKLNGRAYSIYHSLALEFKKEGTNGLRQIKTEGGNWELNYGAIVFGVAMRAIEMALRDGICDTSEILSQYNEAVLGTSFFPIPYHQINSEFIPEYRLAEMQKYSAQDKTHAIFFIDVDAYKTLPQSVRTLIERTRSFERIKTKVIPVYEPLAALFVPNQVYKKPETLSVEKTLELASTMPVTGDNRNLAPGIEERYLKNIAELFNQIKEDPKDN